MSEEQKPGSSAPVADSSASAEPKTEPSQKVINEQDHKRALEDLKKFKGEAAQLRQALEQQEQDKLKSQNNWQALAEQWEKKAKDNETKLSSFVNDYYESQKKSALKTSAMKLGLRTEAESDLDLLDLSDVAIERTDQGRVLVHGAELKAEELKKNKPHWFKSTDLPRINAGGQSTSTPSEVTPAKLFELEKSDPKKYKEALKIYMDQKRKNSGLKSV